MKQKSRVRKQSNLRPTTSRVREALFDILRGRLSDAVFLDLYAGTGAVGIEALKQGASEVVFVEESKYNCRKIAGHVRTCGFSEKSKIITGKVFRFIEWAEVNRITFDIIFMDPPYGSEDIQDVMSLLGKSGILNSGGVVIVEHFKKRILTENPGELHRIKDYGYGDSVLSLYEKMTPE